MESPRNAQEVKEFFAREARMKPKMDAIYQAFGHCVVHRNGNKKYDLVLDMACSGVHRTHEEKFRFDEIAYGDVLVEILQDFITCDPGWYYHCEADYLHYVICPFEVPVTLYRFNWSLFKPFVVEWMQKHQRKLPTLDSIKGYGLTFNYSIPFRDIPPEMYTKHEITPQMFDQEAVIDDIPF